MRHINHQLRLASFNGKSVIYSHALSNSIDMMECIVYTSYNKNQTTKCVLMDRPHILTTNFMNKIMARNKLLPLWNNICVSASIPCFIGILTVLLFYYILFKLNALMTFYWPVIAFLAYTTEAHKKKQLVIKFNDSQSILVIMMAMITAK